MKRETMRAWRVYGVGDIRLDEIPLPTASPGWVVLRIRMIQLSVTEAQLLLLGDFLADNRWEERCKKEGPLRLLGHEFCGEVVEVGEGVDRLRMGDRVFWGQTVPCGKCPVCAAGYGPYCQRGPKLGWDVPGCLAEYGALPAGMLVKVPASVTDSEAAAMQPLLTALGAVMAADIEIGDVIVVLGQGVMGLNCLQLLRYCGASRVIGVDVRPETLKLAKNLGADLVVDASGENAAEAIVEAASGVGADVVFECAAGSPQFGLAGATTLAVATRVVREGGKIVLVGLQESAALEVKALGRGVQFRSFGPYTPKEVDWAVELVASKRVQLAPLITHILEGIESVPQALEITANKRRYGATNPAQVRLV